MTTATKNTEVEPIQVSDEQKAKIDAAVNSLTNKDLRLAARYFETPVDELSQMDQIVLAAHKLDDSKSLEDYDTMAIPELVKVITGK